MGSRPTRRPRWAYDAPGGALVEPPSSFARQGFFTGERPPAEWVNYLLHFQGAWCDYLSGPGWGAWTRVAHGGSAPVFTALAAMAVDADDTRASKGNYRYALAGTKAGPTTVCAVSRTGREWLERDAPGSSTTLLGLLWTATTCILWGKKGSPFETWWTPVEGGSSAIVTSDWSLWTTVGDLSGIEVRGMARGASGLPWALTDNGAGVVTFYGSGDDGATWPTSHAVTPGIASGALSSDLAWDDTRARFVVTSTKGDVFTWTPSTPTSSGAVVVLPGATGTPRVRVRVGDGACLAWASVDAADAPLGATLLWRSEDGGTTWEAVTLPDLMKAAGGAAIVTDVTYADGVWLATTTSAPYLWRSDDGGATWEWVKLPLGEESSWALHRVVYADGAVTATGLTWTVATTRATALAPDATRVYSPEPGYLADAGYLRGRRVAATAPTDGQGLVWDASGGLWVPGAAPSGGVDTSLQTPSDGGWSQTSTGTMIAAAGVVTLTASGSNTVGALHSQVAPSSPHMPAVELRCRVVATSLPAGGVYSLELGITNAAQTLGYRVRLTHNGSIEDRGSTTGSWGFNGSTIGAGLDWSAGTTWLRIVATPAYIALYYGTGVGAAPPTTWTRNAYVYTGSAAPAWDGELSHLHVQAMRASGTGDLVVELHDVGVRSLLGAPA